MLNRVTLTLVLAFSLSGCGFHLRGAVEIPAALKQTRITGIAQYAPLRLTLVRLLTNAGARILPDDMANSMSIQIRNENYARRVLSVDAQGRASEYTLMYSFYFQVIDASGKVRVPDQKIELNRDFRFDPNAVLAKDSEEQQIRADMLRLAAQQLIRRVDATIKNKPL